MRGADTETCAIRKALLAPPLACISWAEKNGDGVIHSGLVDRHESRKYCQKLFSEPSTWLNGPYDWAVIGNEFPELMGLIFEALAADIVFDVEIRQKLIDIAQGQFRGFCSIDGKMAKITYSLAAIVKRLLGIEMEKDEWRLRYHEFRDVPIHQWPKGAQEYPQLDSIRTLQAHLKQDAYVEAAGGDLRGVFINQQFQSRAHFGLHLASCWGIRTEQRAVLELEQRLEQEWVELRGELIQHGMIRKTGARNMKYAKQLMYAALGDEGCKLTDTGRKKLKVMVKEGFDILQAKKALFKNGEGYIALDEEMCLLSNDPRLLTLQKFGHVIKIKNTYVPALKQGMVFPIQSRFEPIVETGRTSSKEPNIQNPPRGDGVRECFIPREGCLFISCDFDKAELCSLAQVCLNFFGYSKLAEALNNGFDPHLAMGARIMGISYEEAFKRRKDPEVKRARQFSKAANFGFPGGLGPDTFMSYAKGYGVDLTRAEAQQLKLEWFRAWPEMEQYFDTINGLLSGGNAIRQHVTGRIRGGLRYTSCCNTFFQGLTADGSKAAIWEVTRRQFCVPTSRLYGTHMVNFLHDEIFLEVPEAIAPEAALELQDVMVTEFKKFHPDIKISAAACLMRRWSKSAEPAFDLNGRLIPWEDAKVAA